VSSVFILFFTFFFRVLTLITCWLSTSYGAGAAAPPQLIDLERVTRTFMLTPTVKFLRWARVCLCNLEAAGEVTPRADHDQQVGGETLPLTGVRASGGIDAHLAGD
jgi:hypothetical protein